jgi:hypothetical protein
MENILALQDIQPIEDPLEDEMCWSTWSNHCAEK